LTVIELALLKWMGGQAIEGAAGYALKSSLRMVKRGTSAVISATGLPGLIRFVPTASEQRFLERVREQVDASVFPWTRPIESYFGQIRLRAAALGGEEIIGQLERFLADRLDLTDIDRDDTGRRIADDLSATFSQIIISCECSSPSSVMMAEIAKQCCPIVQISISGTTPDQQIENLQHSQAEIAIFANAPYLVSSRTTVRDNYKFYCPIYPSYNHTYVRGLRRAPPRKVFILDETSGLEQDKMGHIGDGLTEISVLNAGSSYQICNEVGDGEAVVIWPPLTKELRESGFRELKHEIHQTWIGIYLRKDLMRKSGGATVKRKQIVRLLAWAWVKMQRAPLVETYTRLPQIGSRLSSYWPD
jgi:hypothetical protein